MEIGKTKIDFMCLHLTKVELLAMKIVYWHNLFILSRNGMEKKKGIKRVSYLLQIKTNV